MTGQLRPGNTCEASPKPCQGGAHRQYLQLKMEKENEGYKLLLGAILLVPEVLPDLADKDGETGGGRKKERKRKKNLIYAMRSMFPEASMKAKTVEKEKENNRNNLYRKSTSALEAVERQGPRRGSVCDSMVH